MTTLPTCYYASFNYFEIEMPYECIEDCSHSGQCDNDVLYWRKKLNLQLDPENLRKELKAYGTWDETELSDHDENLLRIIWIATNNIKEELQQNDT